ncbi:MAG: 16S rRNA (cytosine(967)-C(5))-methyltransferase RsmB [Clostridiales bacterium]|nr:16S rRNA (cytosine(967)-C(5))-methyltransferase RsmB [Clostridiales bacterium]
MTASPSRRWAYLALYESERRGQDPRSLLEKLWGEGKEGEGKPEDRALASALVQGVVREKQALDRRLSLYVRGPLDASVRIILRMALYQLLYLSRIPPRAVVHEAVELAREFAPRALGLVNGVLRNYLRKNPSREAPSPEEVFPSWLVAMWEEELGLAETRALLWALSQVPDTVVRVNRRKATLEEVKASLLLQGVEVEGGRLFPEEALRLRKTRGLRHLEAFQKGWIIVQEESSMAAVAALDPQPGELILDVAAAPGGKATYIAEKMDDRGEVVANDIDRERLRLVKENAERLGLKSLTYTAYDARQLPSSWARSFDRVLADLPCSGLGVLHRRADLRWRKKRDHIDQLQRLQKEILMGVVPVLRPGGVLVYSTCTISRKENQEVVEFLVEEMGLQPEDLRPYLPPALKEEPSAPYGWVQLLPHRHGTDGFFIARLRKEGNP